MNLSFEAQVAVVAGIIFAIVGALIIRFVYKRIPKSLNQDKYQKRWSELQQLCKSSETWVDALREADKLFDDALRQRCYRGKKMGARIVAAQRSLSDNDAIWSAHNLAKKVAEQPNKTLKEQDIKQSLIAFRQALRDLGALPDAKKK